MAVQYFTTLRAKSDQSETTGFVVSEAKRALHALDRRLGVARYLAGEDYGLADVLTFPVMATSVQRLPGGFRDYSNIVRWFDLVSARPAVQRGMAVSR
jgi:GST-like protein